MFHLLRCSSALQLKFRLSAAGMLWNVVILVFVFILKSKYQAIKLTPSSIFNKIEIVVIPVQKVWQEKMHGVASSRTIKLKSR